MILEQLAKRGDKRAIFILDAFDPNQPRDENGMWTASGGGGGGASNISQHEAAITLHSAAAEKARSSGRGKAAAFHARARQAHLYVVHMETGKKHLLGYNATKSVEELRNEAQSLSRLAHEEEKSSSKGFALAYSTTPTERADFHAAARAEHRKIASQQKVGSKAETAHLNAAAAHGHAEAANRTAKPGVNYQAHEASNRASSLSAEAHKLSSMEGPMPSGWKPGVGYRPGLNDPKPAPTNDKRDELTTVNFRGGGKGVTVTTAGALEAVKGTDPAIQRSHDFMKDLEAKRAGDKPVDWKKYTVPFGSPRTNYANVVRANAEKARGRSSRAKK